MLCDERKKGHGQKRYKTNNIVHDNRDENGIKRRNSLSISCVMIIGSGPRTTLQQKYIIKRQRRRHSDETRG